MVAKDLRIKRVCPFAAQSCTRKVGCGIFTEAVVHPDNLDEKLRALNCNERGVHLFADEVKAKELRPFVHTQLDRDRYARTVRLQLHGRRRSELQLPMEAVTP